MAKDFDHFSCMDWWNYLEPETNSWFCTEGYGALVNHRWRKVPVQFNTKTKSNYGRKLSNKNLYKRR